MIPQYIPQRLRHPSFLACSAKCAFRGEQLRKPILLVGAIERALPSPSTHPLAFDVRLQPNRHATSRRTSRHTTHTPS